MHLCIRRILIFNHIYNSAMYICVCIIHVPETNWKINVVTVVFKLYTCLPCILVSLNMLIFVQSQSTDCLAFPNYFVTDKQIYCI